mgnify:CR=1 FL=1|jgi:uncharacterized phage-associated protein
MFSEERVAQMAAFFLEKRGGRMAYIKLIKLLYHADRAAMGKWGESISGDCFISMSKGPVLSQTYDLICGMESSSDAGWNHWIQGETNYEVSLKKPVTRNDLDELSDAEIEILEGIFKKFGHFKRFDLVQYTHDHCAEWEEPHGSSFPIRPESIFRALGKNKDQVQALVQQHNLQTQLDLARSSL